MKDWRSELQVLIDAMCTARRELGHLRDHVDYETLLGPPAAPERVAALEQRFNAVLPPSYRTFLELHDGWTEFEGSFDLLSTADHDDDLVQSRLVEIGAAFQEVENAAPLASWGLPIGLTMEGEPVRLAVFDRRRVRHDGEMEVVVFDDIVQDRRFDGFVAFLVHDLSVTRALLRRERERPRAPKR